VRACIVTFTDTRSNEGLDQVGSVLRGQGWIVDTVAIDISEADELDGARREIAASFEHTPTPLRDSWAVADRIRAHTVECDVVILSDAGGLGGIFAVESANHRTAGWPQVWTIAGSSHVLRSLQTSGSLAKTSADGESVLDWEIAQYSASDVVVCRSARELELLESIGVKAVGMHVSLGSAESVSTPSNLVFAPGPVSRLNSSGDVLRAVSGLSEVSVVFGEADSLDEYWSGTTWDSSAALRDTMVGRVSRNSTIPEGTDLVVIGDPFADHASVLQWASDNATPVAAPTDSVVAQQWDDVAQWKTADDLSGIIAGIPPTSDTVLLPELSSPKASGVRLTRARRISVGIPVFGDLTFLGELLASVAAQTVKPHEVVVVSDGAPDPLFVEQMEEWADVFEGRLQYVDQPNRGVCVARNRILELVSGDAVLLVDQDDLLVEHALERMAGALRSNPAQDAVACWTEFFGEYNGVEAKPPFDERVGSRENPIVSTAVLLDRAVIDHGIQFEPDLAFLYCEDWNFWADMVARGHAFGLVPEPLVRHRVHTASGGFKRTELALIAGRDRARSKFTDQR
jgi:hypothetical protein